MATLRSLLEKYNTDVLITEAELANVGPSVSKRQPGNQLVFVPECQVSQDGTANQLCLWYWCVPVGTESVTFEIWGSGGGGAGSCCCQQGVPGGSGAYAVKTINKPTAGSKYCLFLGTIPANVSSCCGFQGCSTYVLGPGLSNFCATGGPPGRTQCFLYYSACCSATVGNIYIIHNDTCCACYYGADSGAPGRPSYLWSNCGGGAAGVGCHWKYALAYPGGLINKGGGYTLVRNQGDACTNDWSKCVASIGYATNTTYNIIPGIGGISTTSCGGGSCASSVAAGPGMVRITYR